MANSLEKKTYAVFANAANKKLISDLEKNGCKVFRFPTLETEKIYLDEAKREFLKKITNFDWLVFTDIYSVEFFLQALDENGLDYFEIDAVKVCALGEAVSDSLRFVQLHADVIPDTRKTEKVFSAIKDYLYTDEIKNLKFLLVKEISQICKLTEKLKENGAEVFELSVYQAKISNKNEIVRLKTLLSVGAVDEFVFSSAADFVALQFYFAGESIADFLAEIQISATSEIVFQTAKELNFRPLYFHL